MGRRIFLTAVLVACGGLPVTAGAERLPEIAIIIDDMGDRKRLGWEALQLPGPVAYAFLPDTPHGAPMAEAAWRANKEVLLHLPMDPVEARAHPTSISAGDDQATVSERLRTQLGSSCAAPMYPVPLRSVVTRPTPRAHANSPKA